MELVTMNISDIKPYPNNPRINDGAVEAVKESIKQCGYIAPIIVDENNVVLAGHTRLKALKSLGREQTEVIVRRGLTEEQKRKYRLLDNKTGEFAEWDFDKLEEELDGLDFDGFDFGFGTEDDFPSMLDAEETDNADNGIHVSFYFENYKDYERNEIAIKEFAESVGAKITVT